MFEECRHEEGREKQDGRPEENIWGVGAMMATCRPNKVSLQIDTLLYRFRDITLECLKRNNRIMTQGIYITERKTTWEKQDNPSVCSVKQTAVKG